MALIFTRRAASLLTGSVGTSTAELGKALCATASRQLHSSGFLQDHADKEHMTALPTRGRKPPPSYATDSKGYDDYMPRVSVAEGGCLYAMPDFTPLRTSISDPQYIPDRSEWRRLN